MKRKKYKRCQFDLACNYFDAEHLNNTTDFPEMKDRLRLIGKTEQIVLARLAVEQLIISYIRRPHNN